MATSKARKNRSSKTQTSALNNWPVKAVDAPNLSMRSWALTSVVGLVLLVMAVLQIISFSDFRDNLDQAGLSAPTAWAVCIVLAELWGSAGFFKVPLSVGFRMVSYGLAILVSAFWFVQNLQLISSGVGDSLPNSGFFGRFLSQTPGWWTAVEVSVLLFVVLYKVSLLRDKQQTTRR